MYDRIREGVSSVMGGQVLEHEAKTIFREGIKEGDDDLTRRFVEKVIVKEDSITVRFKAGIEVTI